MGIMMALSNALPAYGLWAMGGTLALLAAFYLLRGRIRIERGWGGWTIKRFGRIERFAHWLLALSFLVLALTGLNGLYGRYVLLALIGAEAFAAISTAGGQLHAYAGFAFMAGLALTFLLWIRHSLPHWRDVVWLAKAGGLVVKGSHAPAWKFNLGQKILFWLVMLGGLALSLSGIALMFPQQTALVSKTFVTLNSFGLGLPTNLTPAQEAHYATAWHIAAALILVCLIMAHAYFRTLGTEGAFSAMASGEVDVNWARQHHSLWAERELKRMDEAAAQGTGAMAAAE